MGSCPFQGLRAVDLHILPSSEPLPPCRAALASAHQGQPLPKTLSVLESTPQVRGMHTIIRYIPAPGPFSGLSPQALGWFFFFPLSLRPQWWVLAWSRVAEWSWPWPCGYFSGDQISARVFWVIAEPKRLAFPTMGGDWLVLSSLEHSWSSWWHGGTPRYPLPLSQGTWV